MDSQLKVFSKQPSEWVAVQEFLATKRLLTDTDAGILDLVTGKPPGYHRKRKRSGSWQCISVQPIRASRLSPALVSHALGAQRSTSEDDQRHHEQSFSPLSMIGLMSIRVPGMARFFFQIASILWYLCSPMAVPLTA